MVVLFTSVRYDGKSLSLIAEDLSRKRAGLITSLAILFILMLTLANLSLAVVKALFMSPKYIHGTCYNSCSLANEVLSRDGRVGLSSGGFDESDETNSHP